MDATPHGLGFVRLTSRLLELAKDATRIPGIDAGGCGVFAATVARRLHALGFNVWGMLDGFGLWEWRGICRTDCTTEEVRASRRPRTAWEWTCAGVFPHHTLLQFDRRGRVWTYDIHGLRDDPLPKTWEHGPYHRLTYEELQDIAASPDGWGRAFKRQDVDRVAALVDTYLSDEALQSLPRPMLDFAPMPATGKELLTDGVL